LSYALPGFFARQKNILENIFEKFCSFNFSTVLVAKGETENITRLADAKGGEYMNPTSHELDVCRVFDSFCKKILKNEARNCYDEIKRRRDKEVSLSELSEQELEQLATVDKYFATEQIFNVMGHDVIVTDEMIAEALRSLPGRQRDIILLHYFLDLSDGEIGQKLNLIRATVQYQRKSTLRQLKKLLEGQADE